MERLIPSPSRTTWHIDFYPTFITFVLSSPLNTNSTPIFSNHILSDAYPKPCSTHFDINILTHDKYGFHYVYCTIFITLILCHYLGKQKNISEFNSIEVCEKCGSQMKKVFGTFGIQFKGNGFYKTDNPK